MNEFTVHSSPFAVLGWFTPYARIAKLVPSTWTCRFAKPTSNLERRTVNREL